MKSAPFEYLRASSVQEAVEALASNEDAKAIAGGQSLLPMMNMRLAQPALLVDIDRLPGLSSLDVRGDRFALGALIRHRDLATDGTVAEHAPLLRHAAALVGHPAIRNRGTLGGTLAHADPVAEIPTALLALEGEVVVTGPKGTRSISAGDLFISYFTTSLAEDELITEVNVPLRRVGDGYSFQEFSPREGDFAVAGVAVALRRDGDVCSWIRAAAAGMASKPLLLAVDRCEGADLGDDDVVRSVCAAALEGLEPPSDVHASAEYRLELAHVLLAKSLREAWQRAGEEGEDR